MKDRYCRFTIVMDIASVVVIVGAALLVCVFLETAESRANMRANALKAADRWFAQPYEHRLVRNALWHETMSAITAEKRSDSRAGIAFSVGVLAAIFNLVVRTFGWIWVGRFWR